MAIDIDASPTPQDLGKLSHDELQGIIEFSLASIPPREDSALAVFLELQKRSPQDPELLCDFAEFLLGSVSLARGTNPVIESRENLQEAAVRMLRTAIEVLPKSGPKKYFYLGQLSEGKEALECYLKAKELLEKNCADEQDRLRLADTYVAIAELYMTDFCDEPEAQEICEKSLDEAARIAPNSFSVRVQRAVYARVLGELEEAQKEAKLAYEQIEGPLRQLLTLESDDDDARDDKAAAMDVDLPDFEVMLQLGRLAVDIGLTTEASEILRCMLHQNEEDHRVWHRMALLELCRGDLAAAEEAAEHAWEILTELAENEGEHDTMDEQAEGVDEVPSGILEIINEVANLRAEIARRRAGAVADGEK